MMYATTSLQETLAGRKSQPKILGNRLTNVSQRIARAEVNPLTRFLSVNQQGRIFARVIRCRDNSGHCHDPP